MTGRTPTLLLALLCAPPARGAPSASTTSRGQGARRVAVLPIETMNVDDDEARQAEASLAQIVGRRRFEIVPRKAIEAALRGRPSGCARDVPCLREVGRALDAHTLLVLRAGRLGDTLAVQLSAFDVRRGVRQGTWEELLRPPDKGRLAAALRRMVASFAPPPPEAPPPWYRRWWVWTALGAAVAGAAVAIAVGARDTRPAPDFVIQPP